MSEGIQEQTLSKSVSDRLCSGATVLDLFETEAPTLADQLGGVLEPWLAETAATPFASLLPAFHDRLSACRDRLADAAERHLGIRSVADELDRRSDAAAIRLSETLAPIRDTFRSVYGSDQLAHFGFSERTPQRSPVLLERSRELLQRLTDPELELPPSRVPGFDLDCPKLASALVAPIDDLGDVLGAVGDHRRQVRESERLENEALTEFNRVFLQTAGSLESWLRMAGHDDKADRVRPSRRRPGLIYGVKSTSESSAVCEFEGCEREDP